jgi:hypothetical protein
MATVLSEGAGGLSERERFGAAEKVAESILSL